jgi:hypothetical protein
MACTAAACQTRPTRTGAPEDPLPPAVRNRQAAVLYLRAARLADRERDREYLRRHAAELILPRPRARGRRAS